MRIGVIASIAHRLPPADYGPWEQIAATLTEGFVAQGHDVTLFATQNSRTSARLHGTAVAGYEEDDRVDAKAAEGQHIAAAFERAGEFDLLANHFDFMPLTYSRLVATPVVTTIHGFSSERIVPVYRAYDDIAHYVAISDADRHPGLTYAATIHHGIDTGRFTFASTPGDYLLFLGRIHPDKGTHRAIAVARAAGLPLMIGGIIQDERYFREAVQPHVDGDRVHYLGPVGPARRDSLLGGARALLHLISFAEPFGLSVVEALATGTPVIARPLGSMPELLRDGVTGFLVPDDAARRRGGGADHRDRPAEVPRRGGQPVRCQPDGRGLSRPLRAHPRVGPVAGRPGAVTGCKRKRRRVPAAPEAVTSPPARGAGERLPSRSHSCRVPTSLPPGPMSPRIWS